MAESLAGRGCRLHRRSDNGENAMWLYYLDMIIGYAYDTYQTLGGGFLPGVGD